METKMFAEGMIVVAIFSEDDEFIMYALVDDLEGLECDPCWREEDWGE